MDAPYSPATAPRVTVLIPVYNSAQIVLRAIDSALAQTTQDAPLALEILVIDDASTDSTADVVAQRAASDPRIQLHRRPVNGGPAATRNLGLRLARGEWIALLDADDTLLPGRLAYLLAAATPDTVLLADNIEMYDLHAQQVVKVGIDPAILTPPLRLDAPGFVARCRTNQPDAVDFGLLKPLLRRSHLASHRLAYDETLRHGEDFRFFLDTLLAGGTLLVLPRAFYRYTERTGSLSRKASGVSATQARYDILEIRTRDLAADPRYAAVAPQLLVRADAFRKLVKFANFRKRSSLGKLAALPSVLLDPEMRAYYTGQIRSRLKQRA